MARYGALLIPISLVWFAWSSHFMVLWIVPIIASLLFGTGIHIIILSIPNYLIDAYQVHSGSAFASTIQVGNLIGGGVSMFVTQLYTKLGNEWASSLLGFIATLLVLIPWILFYTRYVIRKRIP
ncbi:major facilitator superfamily transporter [Paraphaeosphaeria sporulosa]